MVIDTTPLERSIKHADVRIAATPEITIQAPSEKKTPHWALTTQRLTLDWFVVGEVIAFPSSIRTGPSQSFFMSYVLNARNWAIKGSFGAG
jgi:hypothetical protein